MKKRILSFISVVFVFTCICLPSHAIAYGGGGGGGGEDPVITSGADTSSGSWGVSWFPNPNGADVFGSSIWAGRPENIQQGPYQPDRAVEDAESLLISGFQSGNYTAEQVREQLGWAQRVGIKISQQAQDILNQINQPQVSPAPAVKPSSSPSSTPENDSINDKIDLGMNIWMAVQRQIEENKEQGRQTSVTDIKITAAAEVLKDKLRRFLGDK